jgi:hypothetical protein
MNPHARSILLAATALALPAAAQYVNVSQSYSRSYGDGDAGAAFYANGVQSASLTSETVWSGGTFGYWRRVDHLAGVAIGRAHADLHFLGESKRAGEVRCVTAVTSDVTRTLSGTPIGYDCRSSSSVYLKLGDSVLWNWSFNGGFTAGADYRLRILVPYLVLPIGPGVIALSGRAYARVHGSLAATFDPCAARARIDGAMAIQGDASASAFVISLCAAAGFNGGFVVDDQTLELNDLTAQPGAGMPYTWGRTGSAVVRSGAMRADLEVEAFFPLPPFYLSSTLAEWSKNATVMRIL